MNSLFIEVNTINSRRKYRYFSDMRYLYGRISDELLYFINRHIVKGKNVEFLYTKNDLFNLTQKTQHLALLTKINFSNDINQTLSLIRNKWKWAAY